VSAQSLEVKSMQSLPLPNDHAADA
jgi:hypothetical protein